jgi:hypothetical protein
VPTDNPNADNRGEPEEITAIRASGGPVWIPGDVANAGMDRIMAEADARAFRDWDDLLASEQATTIPHDEARRQLGLPPRQTDASDPGECD